MRNVVLLALAQVFAGSGSITVTLLTGILGARLAPTPGMATMGVSMAIVALACSSIPAALLMQRIGRKRGLLAGTSLGVAAGLLAAVAVSAGSFALLCTASAIIGVTMAFAQQFRFAAAESVPDGRVSRAVSLVMLGTLGAAWLAPEVAVRTRHLVEAAEYAGSFVALSCLYVIALVLLACLRPVHPEPRDPSAPSRPLARIAAADPRLLVAVGCATIAWGVMSFVMTATPVSMHVRDGLSVDATARVIQSHVIAMYAPALLTGWLITRVGLRPVMTVGIALMLGCVLIAMLDRTPVHYWWALVLLGVGWNFLFVGGTTLLATTWRASERFRVQAANDFIVFGTTAVASLGAGFVLQAVGWRALNLATVPVLLLALYAVLAGLRPPRHAPQTG